jgi:hypothetical protein
VARFVPLFVPLLFLAVYLWDGIRRAGGYVVRGVCTFTNRGTGISPTLPTTADLSFWLVPGSEWEGEVYPPTLLPMSSTTERGSFICGTVTVGVNGPRRLRSVD